MRIECCSGLWAQQHIIKSHFVPMVFQENNHSRFFLRAHDLCSLRFLVTLAVLGIVFIFMNQANFKILVGNSHNILLLLYQYILQAGYYCRFQELQLGDIDDCFSLLVVCRVPPSIMVASLQHQLNFSMCNYISGVFVNRAFPN